MDQEGERVGQKRGHALYLQADCGVHGKGGKNNNFIVGELDRRESRNNRVFYRMKVKLNALGTKPREFVM